ncbi:hypothetical protein BaRGS_00017927, partial [Batillaria attramentaria]
MAARSVVGLCYSRVATSAGVVVVPTDADAVSREKWLTVELLNNWGDESKIGLTEIQLLDSAGCALPVPADSVTTNNARYQYREASVLFNGEEKTTNVDHTWTCEKARGENPPPALRIRVDKLQAGVASVRLWNLNDKENPKAAVKSVRIHADGENKTTVEAEINKCGSTEISLTNQEHKDCDCSCYKTVKRVVTSAFTRYGKFVGRHPLPFIILPILLFGGLGAGLAALDTETDMETIYFPKDSRAMDDRQTVRDTFPDWNNIYYNAFSQSDTDGAVTLIFKVKGDDILNPAVLAEIQTFVDQVKNITATYDTVIYTHNDLCARAASQCVVDGEYVLSTAFQNALAAGTVTYPYWVTSGGAVALFTAIGGVTTQSGILRNATVLKISFKLLAGSVTWEKNFLTLAATFDPVYTEVTYETPDSLSEELDKSTSGDIWLFSLTITIMLTYASIVTAGGNPVSTRGMLANGGVLAAGLGILGSMGLLSLCGVKFVNILTVPARLGATFAGAGIGITITSITDFLAFVIGTTSVFRSVTNFSLYA